MIAWAILFIVLSIMLASFWYIDSSPLARYQMCFWGTIFDGDGILHFYEYVNQYGGCVEATYDFTMYILLGIWGLPTYLLFWRQGIPIEDSLLGKMWAKSIDLVALCVCAYLIYRICKELNIAREKALLSAFLFSSGILTIVATTVAGQSDIIGLPFTLLGVLAFLKRDRKKFILFFMIAITCKMFALFVFAGLLLLWEKKIYRIVLSAVEAMGLKLLWTVLFIGNPESLVAKKNFETEMVERLFANDLPLWKGNIPVVVALLLGVFVFCFLKNMESEDEWKKYGIWVPMITMIAAFVSFESSTYWYIHMVPYLTIMLVMNGERSAENFLFETVGAVCCVVANMISRPWAFEINLCKDMLFDKFLGGAFVKFEEIENPLLLENLVSSSGLNRLCGCVYGVFVVLMLTFAWINRPSRINVTSESVKFKQLCVFSYLRFALGAVLVVVPIGLFVINLILGSC